MIDCRPVTRIFEKGVRVSNMKALRRLEGLGALPTPLKILKSELAKKPFFNTGYLDKRAGDELGLLAYPFFIFKTYNQKINCMEDTVYPCVYCQSSFWECKICSHSGREGHLIHVDTISNPARQSRWNCLKLSEIKFVM